MWNWHSLHLLLQTDTVQIIYCACPAFLFYVSPPVSCIYGPFCLPAYNTFCFLSLVVFHTRSTSGFNPTDLPLGHASELSLYKLLMHLKDIVEKCLSFPVSGLNAKLD